MTRRSRPWPPLWLAERDDGLTPDKETEFLRWRQTNPRHEAALARLEKAWNTLLKLENFRPEAQAHPDRDLLAPARRRGQSAIASPLTSIPASVSSMLHSVSLSGDQITRGMKRLWRVWKKRGTPC